ncbi:MAG: magnetosome biogenesis CDF transporter MamM [Nitrospinae bacterium]|nr:magnetosome biogenesis CDF transporter MamM [Nitrospinota bacterium]
MSKAGMVSIFANLILALFKFVVGILSGSKAIMADSLYSFKDFFISLVVFVGIGISGKPPDENHPYGHGKIDFVAIFLISLAILVGTIFLFVHSVKDLVMAYHGNFNPPRFIAFWAALISVIANYRIYIYLHCVGTKKGSPAILANATHNHSDAISSIMVAVGVLGTKFGLVFLDPIVAVIETIDLIRLNITMLKDSINGMMDSSVSNKVIEQIQSIVVLVPGVQKVAKVIGRQVGKGIWVDIAIRVNHDLPYETGYTIGKQVEASLKNRINDIVGINVIIEPHIL